jgi:hypothetical protein
MPRQILNNKYKHKETPEKRGLLTSTNQGRILSAKFLLSRIYRETLIRQIRFHARLMLVAPLKDDAEKGLEPLQSKMSSAMPLPPERLGLSVVATTTRCIHL